VQFSRTFSRFGGDINVERQHGSHADIMILLIRMSRGATMQ
jgi:hypothetical protein